MYITNSFRSDGFGAQYQTIIATILYAELNGHEYVYNHNNVDFKTVYEEETDELYKIMNIKGHFKNIEDVEVNKIKSVEIPEIYKFYEENFDLCLESNTMKKIRSLFILNKNLNYFADYKNYFNVAIHIRRPSLNKNIDIESHGYPCDPKLAKKEELHYISPRFQPDEYYLYVMNVIINNYPDKNIKFHIYSEGPTENFKNFSNCILHLNESLTDTFTALVLADILVTSSSSFSYVAAMLTENIVYAKNFWHRPSSKWIVF